MPGYEFNCDACYHTFIRQISYENYGREAVLCPVCGSEQISRHISPVRLGRSESSRLQEMSDWSSPQKMAGLENNPEELGKAFRKMSGAIGKDMGDDFNDVVERLEHGQSPAEID